jgi:hypothetical protein
VTAGRGYLALPRTVERLGTLPPAARRRRTALAGDRFLTLRRPGSGAGLFVPTLRRRYTADPRAQRCRIFSVTYRNNELGAGAMGHSSAAVRWSGHGCSFSGYLQLSQFIWSSLNS